MKRKEREKSEVKKVCRGERRKGDGDEGKKG